MSTSNYELKHMIMQCSHFLMDQCAPKVREICRQVDRVQVKGSKKPVGLYTIDMCVGKVDVVNLMAGIYAGGGVILSIYQFSEPCF